MDYEIRKILITVKAYPNPGKRYVETVCVAGIDLEKYEWLRLYPIRFRDLEEDKKFKKYNIIRIKIFKPTDDNRPESYKVDSDSIEIIDYLKTNDKWSRRKSIVLPTVSSSMCEIIRQNKESKKSLGVFKPFKVDFYWGKSRRIDTGKIKSYYSQTSLFDKKKDTYFYVRNMKRFPDNFMILGVFYPPKI